MAKTNNPRAGEIPITLINQLNEYTAGGFVLFYFNSESGAPEQIMTFDSPAHCLAFQKHIGDWSDALKDLSIETERSHFISAAKASNSEQGGDEEAEA